MPSSSIYKNSKASIEKRVEDLLKRMRLEEKIDMLGGTGFESKPNKRFGIPALNMTDGPMGVRWGKATAFPAGVAMAASWNAELIKQIGQALARETKAKGRNVLLGPCVNIQRVPYAGRNFESFGEDPYLATRIVVAYVKGVQSEKVIATTKHFACNNQEYERLSIDTIVDERTLNEIYFPAFKAAVQEAGCWAIMCAYNRLNGQHCSSSSLLLTDILKHKWGFKGFVMSDWGAVHSTIPTLFSGLDIEMPKDLYLKREKVLEAVKTGFIKESKINDKVRRMLRVMFSIGLFDTKKPDAGALDTQEHRKLALRASQESTVLMKNEKNLLPLNIKKTKSVAVIGQNAATARVGGGGSAKVNTFYSVSPLEALKKKFGKKIKIYYSSGLSLKEATKTAKTSDVAIVFAGLSNSIESEGKDREDLSLPHNQEKLIKAVSKVNKNTVVVLNSGAPVLMNNWLEQIPALVEVWYPGQEGGNAIADILFGKVNPSGKLPMTFPKKWEDSPAYGNYPGKDGVLHYKEGIFVGYRHFDKKNIEPLFPFGHGLSYTTFSYGDLKITPKKVKKNENVEVRLTIKNTGLCEGAETVQLYLSDIKASVERPPKELKGFKKVYLKPNEKKRISLILKPSDMEFFDACRRDWFAEPGKFKVMVGSSSRDIRLEGDFRLK